MAKKIKPEKVVDTDEEYVVKVFDDIEAEAGGTVSAIISERTYIRSDLVADKANLQEQIARIQSRIDDIDEVLAEIDKL